MNEGGEIYKVVDITIRSCQRGGAVQSFLCGIFVRQVEYKTQKVQE